MKHRYHGMSQRFSMLRLGGFTRISTSIFSRLCEASRAFNQPVAWSDDRPIPSRVIAHEKKNLIVLLNLVVAGMFHDLLCLASYRETSVILVSFDRNGCA